MSRLWPQERRDEIFRRAMSGESWPSIEKAFGFKSGVASKYWSIHALPSQKEKRWNALPANRKGGVPPTLGQLRYAQSCDPKPALASLPADVRFADDEEAARPSVGRLAMASPAFSIIGNNGAYEG